MNFLELRHVRVTCTQLIINICTVLTILSNISPQCVAAITTVTGRTVTLIEGHNGMIPFFVEWSPDGSSVPYFTIRFITKEIPFYVHDRFEPAGFSAEDQGGRFDVLILSTSHSLSVNVSVLRVQIHDKGVYVCSVVLYNHRDQLKLEQTKEIDVYSPPGKAKCFITTGMESPFEAHCVAKIGSRSAGLTCFQDELMINIAKNSTDQNKEKIRGVFFIDAKMIFSCCAHEFDQNVSHSSCKDFVWPGIACNIHTTQSYLEHSYRPTIDSDSQKLIMSGTQSLSPDIICLTFLSTLIGIWVIFVDIPVLYYCIF